MSHYSAYVICTSPRSGSTLLCSLLKATGVAGQPDSWFHQPSVAGWAHTVGVRSEAAGERELIAQVFQRALALGRGRSKLFGLRLQRHSFDFFFSRLNQLHCEATTDTESFRRTFGSTLYIHLTRQNKLEQAISYIKAQQTGLWHLAADGSELERLAPPRELRYDRDQISERARAFATDDFKWDCWFRQQQLDPLRISYEELAKSPANTLRKILVELNLDASLASYATPGVQKMADAVSRQWLERFSEDATVHFGADSATHPAGLTGGDND